MTDTRRKPDEPSLAELARLRGLEREAHSGRKLGPRDRLIAAYHLTRAWTAANATGLRKETFQDEILGGLSRGHGSRQEFRLSNWTLRRGHDPRSEDLREEYGKRKTPQLALEPYLVAISIAARHCGVNPDLWKIDMLRELTVWGQKTSGLEVQPADERPFETLATLFSALCSALGRRNRLQNVFDAISSMNCRWEMFGNRLVPTDDNCLQKWSGPVLGAGDYFEEAFPFPSVSLVRIPYLVRETRFHLAPDSAARSNEAGEERASGGLTPDRRKTIAEVVPGRIELRGHLGWYRDIRLCVLPDGHGGYSAGLESRPFLEVKLAGDHPLAGERAVIGGYEPELSRSLFYARTAEGHLIWPHVVADDGEAWRICFADTASGQGPTGESWAERDPETTGWQFDPDPVSAPGEVFAEPWYLSYTPAAPNYLRHWLTSSWNLGDLWVQCDWSRFSQGVGWEDPDSRWNRELPPIQELNFPDHSSATWIECCLHNGLLEEALQASIDRLKTQAAELQEAWHWARERNTQKLLNRWHPSRDPGASA